MRSRLLLASLVLLGYYCDLCFSGVHKRHSPPTHLGNEIIAVENEHKIVLECQHPDYRTYIKCLKREKRQNDEISPCMDECFKLNCSTSSCIRDCHGRCKQRLIKTYTHTVETTLDCSDNNCDKPSNALPNITTNIHIENVLPNNTNTTTCRPCNEGPDCCNKLPTININNIIDNNRVSGPGPGPDPRCPWCNFPQITIGFGGGGGQYGGQYAGPYGCPYPGWPCYPTNPVKPPSHGPDCILCYYPFLHFECDPSCMPKNSSKGGSQAQTSRSYKS